jgi:hypothetical protein
MDLAKFEASAARFKARTIELDAKRHRLVRIDKPPKSYETAHMEKKSGKTLPAASCRCQAKTMEGKQCGFKATHGDFCKKHAIKT